MKIQHQLLFIAGIFITCIVFSPFVLDFTLTPRFTALAILMLITVLLVHKDNFTWRVDPIMATYFSYVIFCCLSVFWSVNKAEAIFEASRVALGFFVFACMSQLSGNITARNRIIQLSVIITLVAVIVGAYQLIKSGSLNKEDAYLVTGISGHKNLFSSFLLLNLFFLWLGTREFKGTWKNLARLGIALCILMLLFLRTRAIAAGITVSCFFALILYLASLRTLEITRRAVFILTAAALAAANIFYLVILPGLLSEMTAQPGAKPGKYSAIVPDPERVMLWDKTYHLIHKKPFIGTGAGNWQVLFPDATLSGLYRAEDLNYTFQRPHNDLLWILSETGLTGFNLFLCFIFLLFFQLIRSHLAKKPGDNKVEAAGALLIIAYLTVSFFDFPKERIEHIIFFNLTLGMLYTKIQIAHPLPVTTIKMNPRLARLSLSFVALFIIYVGVLRYRGEYHTRKMMDQKFSGNFNAMIRAGKSALSFAYTLDPTSVPVRWYTGNAQAALGNYRQAHKDFLLAHTENPYNRNVLNDLASSLILTGDTAAAINYYNEAARISPRFDEPKLNLAALYIRQNNFAKADHCLRSIYHDSQRRSTYQAIVNMNK
jgi:O-antigen ligase